MLTSKQAELFEYLCSIKDKNNQININWTHISKKFGHSSPNAIKLLKQRLCQKEFIIPAKGNTGGRGVIGTYTIEKNKELAHFQKTNIQLQSSKIISLPTLVEKIREQGFIYLFECSDTSGTKFLKIGWELNEEIKRDKGLQTGNPFEIKPIYKIKGSLKAEKYLHKKFKHLHFRGEWFSYNQEILDLFTNLLAIELIDNLTK